MAEAAVDVNHDGKPDLIRIVLKDGRRVRDEAPCAGCGDRIEGRFVVEVTIAGKSPRETDLNALFRRHTLWFFSPSGKPFRLVTADYNHDGQVDFNLGQFENSNNWAYRLFAVKRSGEVVLLPVPGGEVFASAPDNPSTTQLVPTSDGFQYPAFGNCCLEKEMGWWLFRMRWNTTTRAFEASGPPDRLPARPW